MNAIQTSHKLDFEVADWFNDSIKAFRVGTCHGQFAYMEGKLVMISVMNENPGNGHLEDVFQWFEFSAKKQKVDLVITEFFNDRFKKHCIEKRGYKLFKNNSVIKYYGKRSD